MNRRKFLQISGIFSAYAFSGSLQTMLHASKTSLNTSYLSKDPNRILDIHSSLSYNVISTKGNLMFDGNRVLVMQMEWQLFLLILNILL
ncbi:hypothetical protein CM15mP5_4170 [bacterium]|nr:MAG: hypothetical protein CM15mP5_4170 [bacterium]